MSDCTRGCLLYGQHIPDCTCQHECPEHDGHCEGCLPKPAEVGAYCRKCAFRLRDLITALPDIIADVRRLGDGKLAPPDRTNNGDPSRRATKVDQMSPSPAHDTADEAARWLHSWAIAIADELAERGPFGYRRDGVPEPIPYREARYLTARLAHLCAAEYANDMHEEATQIKYRLEKASGGDSADQRIPRRCPACDQRTLVRPNGAEHVECRNQKCSVRWYSEGYGHLAKVIA